VTYQLAPTAWEFLGGPPELWRLRRLQEFRGDLQNYSKYGVYGAYGIYRNFWGTPELQQLRRLRRLWCLRRLQEFLGDSRNYGT